MSLTPNQLRQAYLNFFKERRHQVIPSASLVPENDPTTLFTGSGMQPLLPYFLGQTHPQGQRLVDSQKCFRSQDIEEVGDNRHTTFFEMLGNWSLGDYFKQEQLSWVFEFLTQVCQLDPRRLYVTVYGGNSQVGVAADDEAVTIWQQLFAQQGVEALVVNDAATAGMQDGRIFYYGQNWWSRVGAPEKMPIGEPGGPDSEIFYDFGSDLEIHQHSQFADQPCHPNCDCGRFMEIGNSVFMTYIRTQDGFEELKNKNIDFGGGLERIAAAINNDPDVFTTQLFQPLIHQLEKMTGVVYGQDADQTRSLRVIADHIRAAVMLAADGVYPSSQEQGYFARRLIRRAIRYGLMINLEDQFLGQLVPIVAELYSQAYPQVKAQVDQISQRLVDEEQKFKRTLAKGLQIFRREVDQQLTAQVAFKLYETYGFPLELSVEEAETHGIAIEAEIESGFQQARAQHAQQSRQGASGKFKGGLADSSAQTVRYHTATHLLHAALRQVLGDHIQQRGSNITNQRLRFDFSHSQAVSQPQLIEVERLVNHWIKQDLPVTVQTLDKQQALDSGAVAFFAEKYPDQVTVYTIGQDVDDNWISKELCGGPHVAHTAEIGPIEIYQEKSAAAGVRRVYARSA